MPSVVSRDEFAELGVDWPECASPEDVMSERRRRGFYLEAVGHQLLVSAPKEKYRKRDSRRLGGSAKSAWMRRPAMAKRTVTCLWLFHIHQKTHSPRCSGTCIERSQLL